MAMACLYKRSASSSLLRFLAIRFPKFRNRFRELGAILEQGENYISSGPF
jgi:hypothetical protein